MEFLLIAWVSKLIRKVFQFNVEHSAGFLPIRLQCKLRMIFADCLDEIAVFGYSRMTRQALHGIIADKRAYAMPA